MEQKIQWKSAENMETAKLLGTLEFQDNAGEWHAFEVLKVETTKLDVSKLVFGDYCNTGFLESGFINCEDFKDTDETLRELIADLEVFYNDGPQYVSRIICNECM